MIIQKHFIEKLVDSLEAAGIEYMISGSVVSSFHGRPRATNDANIVIAPTEKQLYTFAQSLGKDYYVSMEAVREAFIHNSMFNVIDIQDGWKADFIIRKDRAFSCEEFQRRLRVKIMGMDFWITSPEDVILSKLEWAKNRQSQQQFQDALGVVMVQWGHIDKEYLNRWAKELQIESSLKKLMKQAEKLTASKGKNASAKK